MTKLILIFKTLMAAGHAKFDRHDVTMLGGIVLVAIGLACYSVALSMILIGIALVALAIYGASR